MNKRMGAALGGAAAVLALALGGCVNFAGEPTAKQIKKTPRVAVSFKACFWDEETCPGEINSPQQGSYPGHLLVGLRVPKGTKVPTSFSTRRIIGGEGQLILSRNRTYTQELNRKAPRRKNERWLGFSSRPVATDEHDAGQTAVFRVVVRAPKRLLGKQFKVRPVVGWHSPVGDDDRVNVNCHKNVYMKLVGAGVDPYSQCISAPHQSSMDPVVVKLKKPKKKKKR